MLTLWNSVRFLVDYANVEGWTPTWSELESGPEGDLQPLDRWLVARTNAFVAEATAGYEEWLTVNVVRAFESFVEDVSNWYIRRSRRRFYGRAGGYEGDTTAFRVLWYALVQGIRGVSPLMPFLTDHLWRVLTAPCADGALRRSTSPAGRSRRLPTAIFWMRSQSFAGSWSSAVRPARERGSISASRSGPSSSKERPSPGHMPARSPRSSA